MTEWETANRGNVCGEARALTTLAAMSPSAARQARFLYWLRRKRGPPPGLKELSFIHFARTALIDRPDGAYVYFESNFNGRFDLYIDAFSYVVGRHMKYIWRGADGFPGPTPATPFKGYIRAHEFEAAHFYSAYPDATATEVSAALTLRDRLCPLAQAARDAEPGAFAHGWRAIHRVIPPPRGPGFSLRGLLPRDPNVARDGQAYGLGVITPVGWAELDRLRDDLRSLGTCSGSPFAATPRTHFARLVILDRYPYEEAPQLLFSAVLDGTPESYLRELCREIPDAVETIWGRCAGSPRRARGGADAFVEWMLRHQFQSSTFFAPYGDATVEEVNAALDLRCRVRSFADEHQHEAPDALRRAFLEAFVDRGTGCLR